MVLGDAKLVMNSLAEKERMRGQVQMIYIDPPYGIKFGSNWQVSTRRRDVKDGTDASRQPEQVKAFRDTWKDGIHSYLTYLRDRLTLSHDLLTDTGSLFLQIGDENVHLVRSLLDEVFGDHNFVAQIAFRVKSPLGTEFLGRQTDFLLWYARDRSRCKFHDVFIPQDLSAQSEFNMVQLAGGQRLTVSQAKKTGADLSGARYFTAQNLASSGYTASCTFTAEVEGRSFPPPRGRSWKTNQTGMDRLKWAGRLVPLKNSLRFAYFFDDFPFQTPTDVWMDTFAEADKQYVVQTSTKVIERCMLMTTDPGDLVLDPTCGSGSTAFVAEQWGRRWITIDTSRVAIALSRTRLMSARYPYFLLADSDSGAAKERELSGRDGASVQHTCDIRHGFVYKRVPHITLVSIAQNERIVSDMSQQEVDQVIATSADYELLVDQPYEDTKRVRVSGRFTVESLSPHRNIDDSDAGGVGDADSFVSTIVENLRTSGVQNTFRSERVAFDLLEPYAGEGILHAHGTITDADGDIRTVAIMIGPEHGTVSPDMVKGAAREALKGAGFDILIVCGFAFEAYASETAKEFAPLGDGFVAAEDERRIGRLRVLLTHMNPDLAMSNELLKKTGSGNLFTVFGEPDVTIARTSGEVVIEIHGVDVYDPTTGVVRPSSTDDIACWFIDTDYDGEQFFVRHAYFTGADKPYEKLQRSLNADIDEAAWASLYSTTSRPFPPPTTGRIAVKVINHYGDEVLQVYEVAT
jgi:adenine-specific DNA-methyltransferase